MIIHVLENEQIKVSVADGGAELSSVYDKENETERLWDANPDVWNRHAPILFPFVGKVIGNEYRVGERTYVMKTQHGFARDMEFECVEQTKDSVTHRLIATDSTKEIYPYDFELFVTHRLDAENQRLVHVTWEICNNGNEKMYYSIGGHPAFTVPVADSKEREAYYLEFPERDTLTYISVNPANGFADKDTEYTLDLEDGFVQFFDGIYDTLIFDYQNIKKVRIARPDKTPYVTMDCSEFPLLGIWAKEAGNFICLEPWIGRTDNDGFCGTLEEKYGIEMLEPGTATRVSHTIEFHK